MIIITTVGTSLLSNLLKEEFKDSFKFQLSSSTSKKIQNNSLKRPDTQVSSAISEVLLGNEDFPVDRKYKINLSASAEIKSICKIASGAPATVYLLATDTFMSEYAAEQIAEHLNGKNGLTVINNGRINKLKIDAPKEFEQSGFGELIKMLDSIRQEHKDDEIILNISGGYKALIPFLTIYAQLKSLPLKYIYEDSEEVISIGSANLNFDWAIMEALRPYLVDKIIPADLGDNGEQIIKALKESYLILSNGENNEEYLLSPLGKMMVNSFHDKTNLNNKILGTFLEYKYFEYYIKKEFNTDISVLEFDLPYTYEFSEDQNTFVFDFSSSKTSKSSHKAGDIDLILESANKVTLVEVKNFYTLLSYRDLIGKYHPKYEKGKEDYYRKVKAKIEAYFHKERKLPAKFLFLINAILFQKDDKEYQKAPELLEILSHFKQFILKDYDNQISFEAKVCHFNYVNQKKLRVNYDKLLRTPIEESDFRHVNLR